jgi:hypothetical protein
LRGGWPHRAPLVENRRADNDPLIFVFVEIKPPSDDDEEDDATDEDEEYGVN